MYSNAIATGSNVLWVGGNMLAGNETAIKQLDIGGLMVTIKRLTSDTEYIRQVKEEFVLGNFNKMIQGNKLNLQETICANSGSSERGFRYKLNIDSGSI